MIKLFLQVVFVCALLMTSLCTDVNAESDGHRYPIKFEYAIVNYCISADNSYLTKEQMIKKRDACIEILEGLQLFFTYEGVQKQLQDDPNFLYVFIDTVKSISGIK